MKTIKIKATYAADTDMTFIIKQTYQHDVLVKTEVIGFYFGEPCVRDTMAHSNLGLVAEF